VLSLLAAASFGNLVRLGIVRMQAGLRGLVMTSFNADLVADAFNQAGCRPLYCYLTNRSRDEYAYPVETVSSDAELVSIIRRRSMAGELDFFFPTSTDDKWTELCSRIYWEMEATACRYVGHRPGTLKLFLDKVAAKELCVHQEIPTPNWTTDPQEMASMLGAASSGVVCKPRFGMSGRGQFVSLEPLSEPERFADYFFEDLIEGIEFSANVLCLPAGTMHFPLMVKGWTGPTAAHALDKPRFIAPCYSPEFFGFVGRICERLGRLSNACGWLDCEFILSDDRLYLIEVNARYSGCVRACYLATGINPYAVHLDMLRSRPGGSCFSASQCVVELPIVKTTEAPTTGVFLQRSAGRSRSFGRAICHGATLTDIRHRLRSMECIDFEQLDDVENAIAAFRLMSDSFCVAEGLA
jgi:hypothetical protein